MSVTTETVRYGISLDGVSISKHVREFSWDFRMDAPFSSFQAAIFGRDIFDACNPATLRGTARIEIYIDGHTFDFLLESRDPEETIKGTTFGIWGRCPAATLGDPYAVLLDLDYTADTTAKTIAEDVLDGAFTLSWEIEDFVVFGETFSAQNEAPISILQRLANVAGAQVRYDPDLKVLRIFRAPRGQTAVDAETAVAELTDLDNILKLSDSIKTSPILNKVRIVGWGGLSEGQVNIQAEPSKIEGGAFDVTVTTEPQTKLSLIQLASTDGTWQTLATNETFDVEDETWDFRGTQVQAQFPIDGLDQSDIEWLSTPRRTVSFAQGYRAATIVEADVMGLAVATYQARRNRYLLRRCTEPIIKLSAFYEEE